VISEKVSEKKKKEEEDGRTRNKIITRNTHTRCCTHTQMKNKKQQQLAEITPEFDININNHYLPPGVLYTTHCPPCPQPPASSSCCCQAAGTGAAGWWSHLHPQLVS
jgi:hypothetical protein